MAAILGQLGVDWRLLLAQGANFLVVLIVLTIFVWKPLLRVLQTRRERIAEGLRNADDVDIRLAGIEKLKEERMTEAEREAVARITNAERIASARADEIIATGEKKTQQILKEGRAILAQRKEEQFDELVREARVIVKNAIIKATMVSPSQVDEKLVAEAVTIIEREVRS